MDVKMGSLSIEQRKYLREKLERIKRQRTKELNFQSIHGDPVEKAKATKLERMKRTLKKILRMKGGQNENFEVLYDVDICGNFKFIPNAPTNPAPRSNQPASVVFRTPPTAARAPRRQTSLRRQCLDRQRLVRSG